MRVNFHFESVSDMLRAADKTVKDGWLHDGFRDSEFVGREFASWAECRHAALQPWPEGLAILEGVMAKIEKTSLPPPVSRKRRVRYDEADGDEVEPDRFRAGDAAFWRGARRRHVKGPQAVAVFTNVSTPFEVDSLDVFWKGAAAVALMNLLENAGYDVELVAVNKGHDVYGKKNRKGEVRRGTGDGVFASVVLKQAGRTFDEVSLVNVLSGWFFRSVWFQVHFLARPGEVSRNMGYCGTVSEDDPEVITLARGARVIVVDSVFNERSALGLIRETVQEVNESHAAAGTV